MRYGHKTLYTLDSKTLLGFSVSIPANSAADRTTWADWSGGGGVCVGGGGGGGEEGGRIKPF